MYKRIMWICTIALSVGAVLCPESAQAQTDDEATAALNAAAQANNPLANMKAFNLHN